MYSPSHVRSCLVLTGVVINVVIVVKTVINKMFYICSPSHVPS